MGELRTVATRTYQLHANWSLIIANYHECLHCANAHPQLVKLSHPLRRQRAGPSHLAGAAMDLMPGCVTLSTRASRNARRCPASTTSSGGVSTCMVAPLPMLLINPHPDYVVTFMLNPIERIAPDITCHWLMHPDEIARPGFDPSDAVDFWDVTNRQDWRLSDRAQAGISSMGYRPGPYSNREELLSAFDRWVINRVGEL